VSAFAIPVLEQITDHESLAKAWKLLAMRHFHLEFRYEEALEKFRVRDFTDAKILFSRFLEFYPDDLLAKMYLQRALEYEQAPPDEAWEAVEVFQKK